MSTAEPLTAAPPIALPHKRKPNILLVAAPVTVILLGGGLWLQGALPQALGIKQRGGARVETPAFVDLPEMVANLNSDPRHPRYVKLKAKLETSEGDVVKVKAALPRLIDLFQTYLRETRPDELQGALGMYRLRQELIARASLASRSAKVNDVLFSEMLVQ